MFSQKLRLQISLLIYLILLSILLATKPQIFYDENGNIKPFGTNKPMETVFPLWMAILLLAIIAFYLSHVFMVIL